MVLEHSGSFSAVLLMYDVKQGVPPVTVAEWTLQGDQNQDFYDGELVSMFPLVVSFAY